MVQGLPPGPQPAAQQPMPAAAPNYNPNPVPYSSGATAYGAPLPRTSVSGWRG